jgi:hypothetical protein
VFALAKPFKPNLMFVGRPELTKEWSKWNLLHSGRLLAFLTNIGLGWKGLAGPNTLAFCENSYITAVKSFITLGPG